MFVRKRVRDDSDDSDDDSMDVPLGARMKQLAAKAAEPEPFPSTPSPHQPPAIDLPSACLVLILQAACAEGGAIPTAARAACVSRAWRDAVQLAGAALWQHADCSRGWCRPSDAVVSRQCRAGTWSQLQTLNLAGNRSLSDAALHAVAAHCPAVTALDVSGCLNFSAAALLRVLQPPRHVLSLHLARTALRPAGNFDASVRTLLAAAAPSLRVLSLAGCPRVSTATLRSLLACAELRELDLTGAGSARGLVLPLDALQQACPRLEVLRLSGLGLDGGFTAPGVGVARGFPQLRVCELSSGTRMTSHGAEPSHSGVDDALLARLLCSSVNLRELAAAGTHVTAAGLAALPDGCALERLLLDQSDAADDAAAEVAAVQWSASLRVISLAGGGAAVSDQAAVALAACTQLRTADLGGSAVTADGVRALLRARPRLELELAGCRSLERPVRQAALAGGAALRRALGV